VVQELDECTDPLKGNESDLCCDIVIWYDIVIRYGVRKCSSREAQERKHELPVPENNRKQQRIIVLTNRSIAMSKIFNGRKSKSLILQVMDSE
jgi:hypothetical protein